MDEVKELSNRDLERSGIVTSFKRGATVEQVAFWYKSWSPEELQAIRGEVVDDEFEPFVEGYKDEVPSTIAHYIAKPVELDIKLDPTQEKAVELMLREPIGIITGGAGTGKTTTMRAALTAMERLERRPMVALCAPTGKAARRMREATGFYAQTVHRLLGFGGGDLMWAHHAGNALPYDVVIVDEASMLDTALAAALFDAISTQRTRVILTGDVNQLPSVGPGRVFGDLLASEKVPAVRLQHVHRQAQKSWVYRNAPRILEGQEIELDGLFDDFVFFESSDQEQLQELLVKIYIEEVNRIIEEEGESADDTEDALDRVQMLIPQKTGDLGCDRMNRLIQEAIHGEVGSDGFQASKELVLADGDKVIQTKNNYDLGVMNGETGIVTGHSPTSLEVKVDENTVVFGKSNSGDLQLGYAVTIHKMQGSQADTVVLLCTESHSRMMTRQLFYTGVTRAAKRLVLVGDKKTIQRALRVGTVASRETKLIERLNYVMEES